MNGGNKKQFILNIITKIKEKLKINIIFILLFSAYIIVNTINIAVFATNIYDVENNAKISLLYLAGMVAAVFLVILIVYLVLWRINNFHRYILFFSSVTFAVGLVANKNLNMAYNITVLAVLFYIINYCFQKNDETPSDNDGINLDTAEGIISFKTLLVLIAILALAHAAVISEACILRYKSFWSSTFDFGIFAQMFENMAKTGLPITTVERNIELSHFAVHFSPFYYLILPIYMIFRSQESLFVIQILAVSTGVFPLALIAKKFKISNINTLLIVLTYLFYPALNGGLFFDFHENKFLTVLILWLMYFIISEIPNIRKKYLFIYIFAALVLMIKEDSFLYIFCIGLYIMTLKKDKELDKNNVIFGAALSVLSIIYFMFATYYINTYGLGVMTYRFDLFLRAGENSFTDMILNVLKSPAILLSSLISVPDKLEFLFYVFIPLCFLPFVSKRLNFVLLIIPMIIMNLATDYVYQYDINFQYTYGVAPLLFFLAVQNLSKINPKHITKICVTMACFSLVLFMSKDFNRLHSYNYIYFNYKDDFTESEKMLKQIPPDASISATTWIVPHLVKHDKLYMVDIEDTTNYFDYDTEYLVNDLRYVDFEKYNALLKQIEQHGYKKVDSGIFVEIFKKADYNKSGG